MSSLTRIGSVPYLNGKPLTRWFADTPEGRDSGFTVVEAVPSRLAGQLESGEIAVALVSSVELFRSPGLTYVPNIAIAADGPVESVRLLSKVPLTDIKSVALDASSLTSVALLKILLTELYGVTPCYQTAPPDLDSMLKTADAALLIGDIGYREYDPSLTVLDLGAGWKELTDLPFVYAAWVGYPERLTGELRQALEAGKAWGVQRIEEIAASEADRHGETPERSLHYLRDVMRYDLGPREEEALNQFAERVRKYRLV